MVTWYKIDHNLLGVVVWRDFSTMSSNEMRSRTVHSWVYVLMRWLYRYCYLAKIFLYGNFIMVGEAWPCTEGQELQDTGACIKILRLQ